MSNAIETVTLDYSKAPALKARGAAVVQLASELSVTTQEQANKAGQFITHVDELIDEIKSVMDPICSSANAAHKKATSTRAEQLAEPEEAKRIAKKKLTEWMAEEDRKAKAAALAEQQAAQKVVDEATLTEAEELEAAGMPEHAQALVENAPVAPPVPVQRAAVAGFIPTKRWNYEILPEVVTPQTDEDEAAIMNEAAAALEALRVKGDLVMALRARARVIAGRMRRYYMVPNAQRVRSAVNTYKGDASRMVGGIRTFQETDVRSK